MNVRPGSGVRVIATTQLAPASIPGLAGPSDPSVVATRVTFFPGRTAPWVEIWVRRASECNELDAPSAHTYYDLHRPPCDTQEEWLALLATGQTTVLVPPSEPEPEPAPSVDPVQSIGWAKARHDRECNCDPKYLMSCPRMAQAILDGGRL